MSGRIEFPKEYFNPEMRCGHLVSGTMKTVWAAQLEVLVRIAEICERHGLQFYAMFGTLLGAVRHKGYIPWDDDLDIGMHREDYMGFLEVAAQELPPEYQILGVYTDPEGVSSGTRVTNGIRIDLAEKRMEEYHGCPFVVGIDIFPLDYEPLDAGARAEQYERLRMLQEIYPCADTYSRREELGLSASAVRQYREKMEKGLEELEKKYQYPIDPSKSIVWQLLALYDLVSMMYNEEESAYITSHQINSKADRMLWNKEWFAEILPMGFENVFLPAPAGWDAILRSNYGDYMKFPERHETHACYKDQARILIQRGLWKPEEEHIPVSMPEKGKLRVPKRFSNAVSGAGYKRVLYSTSLTGMLRGGENYLQKIRNTIEVFDGRQGVVLWWVPHESKDCLYRELDPELFEEYERLLEAYRTEGRGILDQSDNRERAVKLCDAFYGDTGDLYEMFRQAGKPMMRQNHDILS